MNSTALKTLRALNYVEGTSLLLLFFVGMPLKYVYGHPEVVRALGSLHGLLFLLLLHALFKRYRKGFVTRRELGIEAFFACLPFGMFVLGRRLGSEKGTTPGTVSGIR